MTSTADPAACSAATCVAARAAEGEADDRHAGDRGELGVDLVVVPARLAGLDAETRRRAGPAGPGRRPPRPGRAPAAPGRKTFTPNGRSVRRRTVGDLRPHRVGASCSRRRGSRGRRPARPRRPAPAWTGRRPSARPTTGTASVGSTRPSLGVAATPSRRKLPRTGPDLWLPWRSGYRRSTAISVGDPLVTPGRPVVRRTAVRRLTAALGAALGATLTAERRAGPTGRRPRSPCGPTRSPPRRSAASGWATPSKGGTAPRRPAR